MLCLFTGMASGPGNGNFIQSYPLGEYWWGAAGEASRMYAARALREPVPHQRVCSGAGPVPRELY